MAKVSIVIPTLNRGHLLRSSLKSAVEQTYKDIEIIVCDDCSTDNTKEVVESFGKKNIVYVKPSKRLNMPDSFEFALNKASGEYITFLTDASYLLSDSIDIVMKELDKFNAKLAVWRHCGYFTLDWFEPNRKNTLYIPKVTSKSYLLESSIYLAKFFNNIREIFIPKSINSICHRSVIEKTISQQKRFFLPPCPDHSSAVGMLMNTSEFVVIDKPLFIGGVSSVNIGASQSFKLGKSAEDFFKAFGQDPTKLAFLGIYTTASLIIKSLENARSFYLGSCPPLNMVNALREIVDSLAKLEAYESNIDNYWEILNKYLANERLKIRFIVTQQKILSKLRWSAVKVIRSSKYLSWLEIFRTLHILKGNKMKFINIEECADLITAKSLSKRSGETFIQNVSELRR